jgi:hypothetical protein
MNAVAVESSELVRWECVHGPEKWRDTEVSFQLKWAGEHTFVFFTNASGK